ncbi:TonB-dependent receptor domain-containing protein [Polluticaenibacter yanchengensis]|uniref:TonB-dependent receptor n=1 Tax=Polluticaenibacter yanchengensis TaxID=3014562 RepID=A0ABT4UNJ2_9BACT|nr:TonB-dependent receptor [Chitinophagaceae bacterium LY-5]
MKTIRKIAALLCLFQFVAIVGITQQKANTLKGTVRDGATKETLAAVSVVIKNTTEGTYTDDKGHFSLSTNQKLPITLEISSIGFESQTLVITDAKPSIEVNLVTLTGLGQEVVISATRTPARILESPVSVERLGIKELRNAPSANYYDNVKNLKGVDVVTSGMLFSTPTTRGFAGSGNARLNQLVDGMDNQAPGLNFAVGSTVGLTELDVDYMELLPGASSVLYGSGGMNGTLLINSKNPFKYQGFSSQYKLGVNHLNSPTPNQGAKPYYDIAMRYAKAFNNKFAFKVTAQYIKAQDWHVSDTRNYNRASSTIDDRTRSYPAYDGIGVYGDETNFNMNSITEGLLSAIPSGTPTWQGIKTMDSLFRLSNNKVISRTGYDEIGVVDYNTYNLRGNVGLFYKINSATELSWQTYLGTGTTAYTASDRYSLRDYKIWQHKLEIKNPNWFLRAYTTQENAGDAFNATAMMRILNESQKPSFNISNLPGSWAMQYGGAYTQAFLQARAAGATNAQAETAAHAAARAFADQGRLEPGSARYQQIFDSLANVPISKGGAQFLDRTNLYMTEGQYKIHQIDFMDVMVGASWKRYVLNSEGTLFADTAGRINIDEYGAYIQLQKSLFKDVLKLNAAGRYDKNENFKGRFTPRISAVVKIAKDNNLRFSYQQAYRFPTTQNQWINLPAGSAILIGGLPQLREFYKFNSNPVYSLANVQQYGAAFTQAYTAALQGGASQQVAFGTAANTASATLKPHQFGEYKAESMHSFEVGYKGLLLDKKLLIDAFAYWSTYQNFLGRQTVIQSKSQLAGALGQTGLIQQNPDRTTVGDRTVYSVSVNAKEDVKVNGWGFSADYMVGNGLSFGGNVAYNNMRENNLPTGFISYWNTPKYRYVLSAGHDKILKDWSVNINYRWQQSMYYESDFVVGNLPAFGALDAQISRRLPKIKSLIKLGASNLLNKYYQNGVGNPSIGGLYYISFGYNVF